VEDSGVFQMNVKALGQDRICSVKPNFVYRKDWNFQWDFPFWSGIFHFGARCILFFCCCAAP
jgi:hypothetical protein